MLPCTTSLEQACSDPTAINLGTSDEPPPFGIEPRAAEWTPPATVSEALEEDARLWLRAYQRLTERTTLEGRQNWLCALQTLWPSSQSEEDALGKAVVYARMLKDLPDYLFTEASMAAAGKAFKWFPSLHELSGWLEERHQADAVRAKRCLLLIDRAMTVRRAGGTAPKTCAPVRKYSYPNDCQHAQPDLTHAQALERIRADKRSCGLGPDTDVRPPAPGEAPALYMAYCQAVIAQAMAEGERFKSRRQRDGANQPFWHRKRA